MQVNLTRADQQSETLGACCRTGYFPSAITTFNHPSVIVNNVTMGGQSVADNVQGNTSQSVRNDNRPVTEVQVGGSEKAEAARPNVRGRRQSEVRAATVINRTPVDGEDAGTSGGRIPKVQLAGGKRQAATKIVGDRQRQRAIAGFGQLVVVPIVGNVASDANAFLAGAAEVTDDDGNRPIHRHLTGAGVEVVGGDHVGEIAVPVFRNRELQGDIRPAGVTNRCARIDGQRPRADGGA